MAEITFNTRYGRFTSGNKAAELTMVGYKGQTVCDAGFFYCPYVPLQFVGPRTREEQIAGRRGYLLRCPSAPFMCTGHCKTKTFHQEVEKILAREFPVADPNIPGHYRELDIQHQKDCIEIVRIPKGQLL